MPCDECDPSFSCFDGSDVCRKKPGWVPTASPLYLRAHRALHRLWTRSVETEGYVKADWTELLCAIDAIEEDRKRGQRDSNPHLRSEGPGS